MIDEAVHRVERALKKPEHQPIQAEWNKHVIVTTTGRTSKSIHAGDQPSRPLIERIVYACRHVQLRNLWGYKWVRLYNGAL